MVNKGMVIAAVIIIAAVFYAYNLQLKVDSLEKVIGSFGDPKIAEFTASIGTASYHITEQAQDYASGSYFTPADYNDNLASTPTIIFNCKYAREGAYTWMDPELERLDLKNKTCSVYGCELTADEKNYLNDKLSKMPVAERVGFYELEYGGCSNKIEVYCSPTSTFCKEQQPIVEEVFEELGLSWEMVCIPSRSIDPALCNMLLSFGDKTDVSFTDVVNLNKNLNFCEVSVALDQLEEFGLVEKTS